MRQSPPRPRDGAGPIASTPSARDPDNVVYDAACELLLAARDLEHASARKGVAAALPATLACLENAFGTLAASFHELGSQTLMHSAPLLTDEQFVAVSRLAGGVRHDLSAARDKTDQLRSQLVRDRAREA